MQIGVMLANKCNLRCSFCQHWQNENGSMMTLSDYESILHQLPSVSIHGQKVDCIRMDANRESFLYPNIDNAVKLTKSSGFGISIVTNGVLMNQKNVHLVVDNCVDVVSVSITGTTGAIYAHFQGGRSDRTDEQNKVCAEKQFELVIKNVKELVRYRNERKSELPKIHISYILTGNSICEIDNAISFWKDIGVDKIGFVTDTRPLHEFCSGRSDLLYGIGTECLRTIIIATNGDVYPCCAPHGESIVLGNCFAEPLSEIFSSRKFEEFGKNLASLRYEQLPNGCKDCPAIAYPTLVREGYHI